MSEGSAERHVVVAAAVVAGDRVLLGHRHPGRPWYPGVWDLPGGHVEAGERRIDALVRELREELGIDIHPQLATSVLRHSPRPDLDIEVWAVHTWAGDLVNAAPVEHDRIGWFTVTELNALDLADPGVATACERALQHVCGGGPRAAL